MDKRQFVEQLSKLRQNSTLLYLSEYRNEYLEVSDFKISFHISYLNALKKSVRQLKDMNVFMERDILARKELIRSFSDSIAKIETTEIEDIDDAYTRFFEQGRYIKGVKMHTVSGELHLYGLLISKRVITAGKYPTCNSAPLTIAKNKLRAKTAVGNFRQFKIMPSQVGRISVEKLSLDAPC